MIGRAAIDASPTSSSMSRTTSPESPQAIPMFALGCSVHQACACFGEFEASLNPRTSPAAWSVSGFFPRALSGKTNQPRKA